VKLASARIVVGMAGAVACSPVSLGDGEKRVVVQQIASEVITPTLRDLDEAGQQLATRCEGLEHAPSLEQLSQTQQAWREARAHWKRTLAFGFGPAMDLRIDSAIDRFPVDPALIDAVLTDAVLGDPGIASDAGVSVDAGASSAPITVDDVEELGANRKGFHALEYLLFAAQGNDVVLASLTDAANAPRRLSLVTALSQHLAIKVDELLEAWTMGSNRYIAVLTDPGDDNAEYPTVKKSVDALVNESVFLSERVADAWLGKPLGVMNASEPQPELEESALSDNSLSDITNSLRSIRNVYLGTTNGIPGNGIISLVQARSAATDRAVRDALDDAFDAVEEVPRPFNQALYDDRAAVQRAYDAVKVLKRVLTTEVVGALGAALKFNDNDGD
jgi:predicted lipoprotein